MGFVLALTASVPALADRPLIASKDAAPAPKVLSKMLPRPKAKWTPQLFFHYGEHMNWSLQLRGVEGGIARLAVGQPGRVGDRVMVVVRGQAETTGVIDSFKHIVEEAESYLDVGTGMPVISESRGQNGKKLTRAKVQRKPDGSADVEIEKDGKTTTLQRTVAADVHDGLSTLAALRVLPGAGVGATKKFIIYSGVKRWAVEATYKGREKRDSVLGETDVFRIEGTATRVDDNNQPIKAAKAFTGWFTADQRRVPVRFQADTEYGEATLILTSYSDK